MRCETHGGPSMACTECIVEQMDHTSEKMERARLDLEAAMWLMEQAMRKIERYVRGEA